jgi:hypothetical protein
MKIFILGTGKSGTTALVYKVAGGLPNCQAFSGGHPGKYVGNYENAVYKHTYEERKGKNFELYRDHLKSEHYDRKIWMARDPRDVIVSRMLYRWHKGYRGHKNQFDAHLKLVLKKEKNPSKLSFYEICRYSTNEAGWPADLDLVMREETIRYQRMCEFVRDLGEDWFLFKYEDMVNKNTGPLNQYLGFDIQEETEVPKSTGKAKVVRKKSTGDWRHWFTPDDVDLAKSAYLPYMEALKYDCEDWTLAENPFIEPQYSSDYIQKIARQNSMNKLRSAADVVLRRFFK